MEYSLQSAAEQHVERLQTAITWGWKYEARPLRTGPIYTEEDLWEMRAEIARLRETLKDIGVIVGVTKDSPVGERSVTVAVHALKARENAWRVLGMSIRRSGLCGTHLVDDIDSLLESGLR